MASSFREREDTGGGRRPPIPDARNEAVEDRNEDREECERPEQTVRSEKTELDEGRTGRDENGEEDPSQPGVRRRFRIRDHEKGEEKERAALQTVQRDRERLAERRGPGEKQQAIESEERQGDVASGGSAHDEDPRAGDREGEEGAGSPLAGRNPDAVRQDHHRDEAEVRRVEDVFAVPAEDDLRGDRDDRGDDRQERRIRSKEEAQREAGDEGAANFDGRKARSPRAEELSGEDGADQQSHARESDVEVEESHPVQKEGRERADLKEARVLSREPFENHPSYSGELDTATTPAGSLGVGPLRAVRIETKSNACGAR